MTERSRLIAAGVNFGLTVYSAFVTVIVQLLHCVQVPIPDGSGDESRLFIQGSVLCDLSGWQAGYLIALVLLIAVPFGLIPLARWSARERTVSTGSNSQGNDTRLGVARALHAAYSVDIVSWESVLMVHRLALALLYTFATSTPVIQTSLCAVVTTLMLLLHVYCQPMRGTDAQPYQTLLLACLLLVTVSKTFEASVLQVASPKSDAESTDFLSVTTVLFGFVAPLLGLVACYRREVIKRYRKLTNYCCHSRSSSTSANAVTLEMK